MANTETATATATATNNVVVLINNFINGGTNILPNDKKKELLNTCLKALKDDLENKIDDLQLSLYIKKLRKDLTVISNATKLTNLKSLISEIKDVTDLIDTKDDISAIDSFLTYGKQVIKGTLQNGILLLELPLMNNGTATSQKSGKTYDYLSRSGTGFYSSQILDVDGTQYSITFSIYKEISK